MKDIEVVIKVDGKDVVDKKIVLLKSFKKLFENKSLDPTALVSNILSNMVAQISKEDCNKISSALNSQPDPDYDDLYIEVKVSAKRGDRKVTLIDKSKKIQEPIKASDKENNYMNTNLSPILEEIYNYKHDSKLTNEMLSNFNKVGKGYGK